MLLLFLACTSESSTEQACFLTYLDESEATNTSYYTCEDAATTDEARGVCIEDLNTSADSNDDTLTTCAGDGCVTDWLGCVQADVDDDIVCFETLETCGGWISVGLVNDCFTDANACGDADSCSTDFYDCMRYAAGG